MLPASIGGVAFHVERVRGTGGRRVDIKPYPLRDGASIRDLGSAQGRFAIDAFVVGDEYDLDRDELERVLSEEGPHSLVHPYRGTVDVSLSGEYTVVESADADGGFAAFTIPLIIDHGEIFPTVADTATALEGASASLAVSLASDFEGGFSLSDAVNGVVSEINGALFDASTAIALGKGKIAAVANVPATTLAALDRILEQMTDLAATPGNLARSLISALGALWSYLPTADDEGEDLDRRPGVAAGVGLGVTADAVAFSPKPTVGSGVQAGIEAVAKAKISQLVKVATISAASAAVVNMQFDSGDQAQAFAADFLALIDETLQAEGEVGDQLFLDLEVTKAALHDHLTQTAQELPRVTTYFVSADTPALVLAYELLGDATLAGDLVRRNKIRNPNAVPGGTTIEVLIDG